MFDIPHTGSRSELRNYNTIIQVLSLKTQPHIIDFPDCFEEDLANYNFGSEYSGVHKIWTFTFEVEHPDLFVIDENPIGVLINDSDLIPMIDNRKIIKSTCCLRSIGDLCNIYYVLE